MQKKTQQLRYLFNVSNLDIISLSMTGLEFIYHWFWTNHEIFLSLKYLFHFFVPLVDCIFYKSTEE